MPIPSFNKHGILPPGIHRCTTEEVAATFAWNERRDSLFQALQRFLAAEVLPYFAAPVYCDGSFVTDKVEPGDIDVVLDLTSAPDDVKWKGLLFWQQNKGRIAREYSIDFLVNLPGNSNFCDFFQYLGVKSAKFKGLDPRHLKGILRIH